MKNILLLIALCSAWSCTDKVAPWGVTTGSGSIVIQLNSEDGLTLKTKDTEEQERSKGTTFNNVLVILVDNTNRVAGKQYVTSLSNVTNHTITFSNLLPGHYTAYAYANIDQTIWQNIDWSTITPENSGLIPVGGSFSAFADQQLLTMSSNQAPTKPLTQQGQIPLLFLTGKQAIEVGVSETVVETIYLKRPVVRFKVTINNNTNYKVTVNTLSFSNFSPDRAYLIERDDDGDGNPDVPSETIYRELPAYDANNPISVSGEQEVVIYDTYLYENASPNNYKVYSNMTLTIPGSPDVNIPVKLGERPFGPIDYNMLKTLNDGESVDVLIINPQINKRYGRLLCHINNKQIAWESVGYTEYDKLFARAKAIYNGNPDYDYGLEGYDPSDNDMGYSSWNGVDDPPSKLTKFDYTGAEPNGANYSKFFRTISKSNGKYTIDGLATNTNSSTIITNLIIEKGNYPYPADNKITNGLSSLMIKFKNANNTSQVLKTNANDSKLTKLAFDSNSNHQDRHFILFGKCNVGGLINRINESNREVPLTYMSRNEVVNLVINVYYADTNGTLSFIVDNASSWDDSHKTISSHTFH